MRGFFVAGVAVGALFGVASAKEQRPREDLELPKIQPKLSELLEKNAGDIPWDKLTPESLGMKLNFSEMSEKELRSVASNFKELGLIPPEEEEELMSALQHPQMRMAMKSMVDNWPQTIERVLEDPEFVRFLDQFGRKKALPKVVGLDRVEVDQVKEAEE